MTNWLGTSLPIFVVESFYLLLTYVDILALEHLGSPQDVAIYFAGARLLSIVAFVYYAIAGTTTHKFTQFYVTGDNERLRQFFRRTVRWTFWPSLVICGVILALGNPLLLLFGPGFDDGYSAMVILAFGMIARAAVGPAERLLNMLGDRKPCAAAYALAFVINLALCFVLIPRFGIDGAAAATSTALVVEFAPALRCRAPAALRPGAAACARGLGALAQQAADHLARRRHRHVGDEGDLARIFVRGEPRLARSPGCCARARPRGSRPAAAR